MIIKIRYMALVAVSALAMSLTSCDAVFDDLEPCRTGAEMRFIFEYNLENSNSFHSNVDCLSVFIYDSEGRYVTTLRETSERLADENWRLSVELPEGDYKAVVYGGMECGDASFGPVETPGEGTRHDALQVRLKQEHVGKRLHDHYHGAVDFTVKNDGDNEFDRVTVPMARTTNHFRILMQNLSGEPLSGEDFDFYITEDNSLLDNTNVPVATGTRTVYTPWDKGVVEERLGKGRADGDMPVIKMGYAELSTSRVYIPNKPVIRIDDHETGRNIATLPLAYYLAASQSSASAWSDQEYIDRGRDWSLTFFLQEDGTWFNSYIMVNGWSVRVNEIDMRRLGGNKRDLE